MDDWQAAGQPDKPDRILHIAKQSQASLRLMEARKGFFSDDDDEVVLWSHLPHVEGSEP